jgi:hypothetical protein
MVFLSFNPSINTPDKKVRKNVSGVRFGTNRGVGLIEPDYLR